MGKLVRLLLLLGLLEILAISSAFAMQSEEKDVPETENSSGKALAGGRLSLSLNLGMVVSLPGSNFSPYGVHYRNRYNCGTEAAVGLSYLIGGGILVGAKCDVSSFSANYALYGEETPVTDDIGLFYLAPQLGERWAIGKRFYVDWMLGAGYLHYKSESLLGEENRKAAKGLFGYHADASLNYRLGKSFAVGCSVSWMGGKTSSLNEEVAGKKQKVELGKKNQLDANRLNFTIALTGFW